MDRRASRVSDTLDFLLYLVIIVACPKPKPKHPLPTLHPPQTLPPALRRCRLQLPQSLLQRLRLSFPQPLHKKLEPLLPHSLSKARNVLSLVPKKPQHFPNVRPGHEILRQSYAGRSVQDEMVVARGDMEDLQSRFSFLWTKVIRESRSDGVADLAGMTDAFFAARCGTGLRVEGEEPFGYAEGRGDFGVVGGDLGALELAAMRIGVGGGREVFVVGWGCVSGEANDVVGTHLRRLLVAVVEKLKRGTRSSICCRGLLRSRH